MNSAKEMQYALNNSEPFKMVQARLYQINKGLSGVSSFVPISFDREYTCLSMSTCHSALIDYRFRMLPAPMFGRAKGTEDFELVSGVIDVEDQTFIENGIVVESKYDPSDLDKKKMKQ